MHTSRRSFLKKSALAAAGTAMFSSELFAASKKSSAIFGIQLYSVRDDMSKDAAGTLKKLADMGYKYVEHASYGNRKFYKTYTASDLKKLLSDISLTMS